MRVFDPSGFWGKEGLEILKYWWLWAHCWFLTLMYFVFKNTKKCVFFVMMVTMFGMESKTNFYCVLIFQLISNKNR